VNEFGLIKWLLETELKDTPMKGDAGSRRTRKSKRHKNTKHSEARGHRQRGQNTFLTCETGLLEPFKLNP
jgi:hypothetical protein